MSHTVSDNIRRLPEELRQTPQWCIAGPDKEPYTAAPNGVYRASVQRPSDWKNFEQALSDARSIPDARLGFVIHESDPFTCIDLDVKGPHNKPDEPHLWTTPEQIQRFQSIVAAFDSYTERSTSGYGLHVWVRGRIGRGCKRDGVEVYSQERFMICTGDVYLDLPIRERQDLLDQLVAEMRTPEEKAAQELVEIEPEYSDIEIFDIASNAANKEKFDKLCRGDWQNDYPSQSEADLALMSMFTFYSKSNEQCRRLFRCTALGQREKAVKNNRYLDDTLRRIRYRQAGEERRDEIGRDMAAALVAELQGSSYADVTAGQMAVQQIEAPQVDATIDWPPGLMGAVAAFIYNSAPRPVKEVAIVAALGLLAGVCGKAFNIPQSGLNLYVILVARSGVGKEAMHSGLSLICEELRSSLPAAQKFVDFNDFASGPALIKACAANQSFVNVAGEWGRKLKRLAEESRVDGPMSQLRTVMTNLYQKSAAGSLVGGISYSNKEQNISTLSGVAYSMIGETTPGTFYDSLTTSMMEDGFLSRFVIIDYTGERPPLNSNPERKMHPMLAQALHGLCAHSLTLLSRFNSEIVQYDDEARGLLTAFDLECDGEINSTADEGRRQMWNRAHLKVCRVASLLAVADNWLQPVVNIVHARWALDLIRRDIDIMSSRIASGDVGMDDVSRERKMIMVLRAYLEVGPQSDAYGCPQDLKKDNIIPRRYIQMRLSRVSQFVNTRLGATPAIDQTIKSLIDNGYLLEMDKTKVSDNYGYHGKCYRIVSLPPLKGH